MKLRFVFPALALLACGDKDEDDGSEDGKDTSSPVETGGPTGGETGDTALDPDADEDGYPASTDCDDSDPEIHPDATEICDGLDNDCDEETDEDDAADAGTWYLDADDDGYGDESQSWTACDVPSGYVAASKAGFDCDDSDPAFHPGAEESDCADPSDYNCDGSVAYEDSDADGWAACEECDDTNAEIHPDASEICDEIDNDCDGLSDDEDDSLDIDTTTAWYTDADSDGYGDEATEVLACLAPSGTVEESADGFDCDDSDPAYYPGADESDCTDPNDYNCDGSVAYEDSDADGWAACEECDDRDDDIHPDATEICDEIDNDCDGEIDDADSDLDTTTGESWYADSDGDGFGDADTVSQACEMPSGTAEDSTDCDDADSEVNPDATEICDEIDNDCDEDIDDADSSLADARTFYIDHDADGYGSTDYTTAACEAPSGYIEDSSDCDDTDSGIHPGASELCDEADNDCDGTIDEEDALDPTTWYADSDGDGYGDAASTSESCDAASGYVDDATDCDDTDATIHPGASELCDEIDNDCDSLVDDEDTEQSGTSTWYIDYDGDGYGSTDYTSAACEAPSGYIEDATDCDDSDAEISPDGTELCDGVDNDCDGLTDDEDSDVSDPSTWYIDSDGDGYGSDASSAESCDAPTGYVSDATDCDDSDGDRSPGAIEVDGDEADNNCVNDPPQIASLSLSPSEAYTDDTLSLDLEVSDPDGDAISYAITWSVDGSPLSLTDETLDGSLYFDRDQSISVEVIPTDGTDAGDAVEASLSIANSPPETPEIALDPAEPIASQQDLLCDIVTDAVDADGDAISYTIEWTVDGLAYTDVSSTTHTGDTVAASELEPGENWICTVTPTDGDDEGPAASATATVATQYGQGTDGDLNVSSSFNLHSDDGDDSDTEADGAVYTVASLGTDTAILASTPSALVEGDEIILINMQGSESYYDHVGQYEFLRVSGVSGDELTFSQSIRGTYGTTSNSDLTDQQVIVQRVPNYQDVTVSNTVTVDAWDGSTGGLIVFRVAGTLDFSGGGINATALGYGLCPSTGPTCQARQGESINGAAPYSIVNEQIPNIGGGGAGKYTGSGSTEGNGGGGGYGSEGSVEGARSTDGYGGETYGDSDLSESIFLGSAGGGHGSSGGGTPGRGGGIVMIFAETITDLTISSDGDGGSVGPYGCDMGSGSGGAVYIISDELSISSLTAGGGSGPGGDGGDGRIYIDADSVTGSSTPTFVTP